MDEPTTTADTVTAELPIPEDLEATVARLPEGVISAWHVSAGAVRTALELRRGGWTDAYVSPAGLYTSWWLCSRLAAAARMRLDDRLDVGGEAVDAARHKMPWLDSYDLVTASGEGGIGASYTFWQTRPYEPVPEDTYLLECWYVSADRDWSVTFGWRVLTDGPARGRIIHQRFDLTRNVDGWLHRQSWAPLKHLLKVLDIYERDYPYFPGFAPARAEGRRIVADVTVKAHSEEDTGVIIPREVIGGERPWIDSARAIFSM